MRQLNVFVNDRKAGLLTEETPGRGYTFAYAKDYLSADSPAVSVTLPKREEPYKSEFLFPFFANIIPEGANRKAICRKLRIDEDDLFGILMAMAGKDFIGAVELKRVTDD